MGYAGAYGKRNFPPFCTRFSVPLEQEKCKFFPAFKLSIILLRCFVLVLHLYYVPGSDNS
jgi:hypothetical protein